LAEGIAFKDFVVMLRRLLTESMSRFGCELTAFNPLIQTVRHPWRGREDAIPVRMVENTPIDPHFSYRIHIDGVAAYKNRKFGFFLKLLLINSLVEVEIYDVYDTKSGRDTPIEEEKLLKDALGFLASQLEK